MSERELSEAEVCAAIGHNWCDIDGICCGRCEVTPDQALTTERQRADELQREVERLRGELDTAVEAYEGQGEAMEHTIADLQTRADSEHEARVGVEVALHDAASSLDAISRAGTSYQPYLDDIASVRGYAANRAMVARTHLPAPQGGDAEGGGVREGS